VLEVFVSLTPPLQAHIVSFIKGRFQEDFLSIALRSREMREHVYPHITSLTLRTSSTPSTTLTALITSTEHAAPNWSANGRLWTAVSSEDDIISKFVPRLPDSLVSLTLKGGGSYPDLRLPDTLRTLEIYGGYGGYGKCKALPRRLPARLHTLILDFEEEEGLDESVPLPTLPPNLVVLVLRYVNGGISYFPSTLRKIDFIENDCERTLPDTISLHSMHFHLSPFTSTTLSSWPPISHSLNIDARGTTVSGLPDGVVKLCLFKCTGLDRFPRDLRHLTMFHCENVSVDETMTELETLEIWGEDCIIPAPIRRFPPNLKKLRLNGEHARRCAAEALSSLTYTPADMEV